VQLHPFTLVLFGSAAISVGLARTLWHRAAPGARTCAVLMLSLAWWSTFYAAELLSTTQSAQLAWAPLEYVGILFAPGAWLVFALRFTGRDEPLDRRAMAGAAAVPIALFVLVLTDPWHHLDYRAIETIQAGSYRVLRLTYGPAGWANVAYAYLCLAGGALVIARAFWRSPRVYRRQTTALLASAAAPWAVNVLYMTGYGPAVDLTPLGFTITGLGAAWAIRHAQLLDLAPVARDRVVESLSDGIAVLDRQDRLIDHNAAFHAIVGDVTIGASAAEVFAAHPAVLAQLGGGPVAPVLSSRADGDRQYEPKVVPLKDRRGRDIGRLVTLHDVTERRKVVSELSRARDAAERLANAKSEFLATVSHEIRTPMNGVVGMTSVLLDTPLTPEQRDYVETIRLSGEQLLSIINDILDFSRIDSDRLVVERIAFAPGAAVTEVLALLRPQARARGLALSLSVSPDVPARCLGDATRVRQIASNLVGNAIKFTPSGRVSVALDADPPADGAQRLRLTVRDTGIGIPADRIDSLFQPFTQVDASTARRYGGSGLGLAISRRLAELMGGTITVESDVGRGTIFRADWRVVPAADGSASTVTATAAPVPAGAAPTVRRILVAEDNPVNQTVVAHMLKRLGAQADLANDGEEAVAAVARGGYDIVLMDVQMPNVDGLDATRRIRAAAGPQPRIIAMTANAMAGDRERCLAAGMDDYVSKPISVESLQAALERSR
jgi:signal transduction histidine kinase